MLTWVRRLLRRWSNKQPAPVSPEAPSRQVTDAPQTPPALPIRPGTDTPDDEAEPVQDASLAAPPTSPIADKPVPPAATPASPAPPAATPVPPSTDSVDTSKDPVAGRFGTPPSLDTPAPESDVSLPISLPADEGAAGIAEEETALLTDFSDVTYPSAGGEYAQPPGVQHATKAQPKRRWASRRSPWRPAMTVELVRELEERSGSVSAMLEDEPVEVSWPAQDDHGESGFRVLEPEAGYFVAHGEARGTPRTLDLALPERTPAGEPAADDLDRLELVRLVAIAVEGLHRADVVTAGLGWSTFLFVSGPRPAVVLHGPEHIRRLGGEFLAPAYPPADDEGSGVSPFDADRFRLAALAYRLLVSHELDGDIDPWNRRGIPGLADYQVRRAWQLWERSTGPAGTRPQASEWMEALGV